jgi:transcriptional regulator with XRE-family HTH domain
MVLLRRVIGDALRARRQGQHRTLREVSTAANVSLGYLSEIERGQKEASSELLAAICDALGAQLSDVLRQVSDTLAMAEEMEQVLAPVGGPADADSAANRAAATRTGHAKADPAREDRVDQAASADAVERSQPVEAPAEPVPTDRVAVHAFRLPTPAEPVHRLTGDGEVTVSVRRDSPLRTTLKATRPQRADDREREVVYA